MHFHLYENHYIQNLITLLQLKISYKNKLNFIASAKIFAGIGDQLAQEMYSLLSSNGFDFEKTIKQSNSKTKFTLDIIRKIVNYKEKDLSDLISYICDIYYKKYMYNKYDNALEKYEDIEYLIRITKGAVNLESFLDAITLDKVSKNSSNNCLTVTTMHKSKGLEWDIVFLPFINKNEYPRCKEKDYVDNAIHVQNERNLFYVAITRAKKQLFLSYSLVYEDRNCGPSPFLEELDSEGYDSEFFE